MYQDKVCLSNRVKLKQAQRVNRKLKMKVMVDDFDQHLSNFDNARNSKDIMTKQ